MLMTTGGAITVEVLMRRCSTHARTHSHAHTHIYIYIIYMRKHTHIHIHILTPTPHLHPCKHPNDGQEPQYTQTDTSEHLTEDEVEHPAPWCTHLEEQDASVPMTLATSNQKPTLTHSQTALLRHVAARNRSESTGTWELQVLCPCMMPACLMLS